MGREGGGSHPEDGSHPTEGDRAGDDPEGGRKKRHGKKLLDRMPDTESIIRKFTGRDVAEGFIGGILFSLPLLVEDGVFEIAEWLLALTVGPIPVFLVLNVLFIVGIVAGLLYYTDIRNIQMRLLFGFVPKRLVGILAISFVVAVGTMFLWGRLHEEDPTNLERLARITVIWAPAALGATLTDILPGESRGQDLVDTLTDRGLRRDEEIWDDE